MTRFIHNNPFKYLNLKFLQRLYIIQTVLNRTMWDDPTSHIDNPKRRQTFN